MTRRASAHASPDMDRRVLLQPLSPLVPWRVSVTVLIAVSGLMAASVGSAAERAATNTKTIATVATIAYRAVVVARRNSGGRAPTAAVSIDTYERSGRLWQRIDARALSGLFFWKTVTGPHALCSFEIATSSGGGGTRPHVVVQLLRSPSLGCAGAQTIPIPAS